MPGWSRKHQPAQSICLLCGQEFRGGEAVKALRFHLTRTHGIRFLPTSSMGYWNWTKLAKEDKLKKIV